MEKKGLGKGLGALIPGAEDKNTENATEISIDSITYNPYQPRKNIDEDKLTDLQNSIKVHGVLQPILVRKKDSGGFELIAGERRLRAARNIGLKSVPALVKRLTDQQTLQIALIENLQREDIDSIDAAIAYKRLADEFNMSQDEIAVSIGKSRSAITNTLRLLQLPNVIQNQIKQSKISEGHARAILSLKDERQQIELCDRIIESGLSVRDSERAARQYSEYGQKENGGNVSRETFPPYKDPNLLELEAPLRETLGTKVTILKQKDRGKIEIEFYSEDDLERLASLLADV